MHQDLIPAALVAAMFQRIPRAHIPSPGASCRNRIVPLTVGLSIGDFRLSATCLSINKGAETRGEGYKGQGIRYNEQKSSISSPVL